MESTATTNFWKSFKYYTFVAKILGMEYFLKENYPFLNWRSFLPIFLQICFYFQVVYTICSLGDDLDAIMKTLFAVGIVFQVSESELLFDSI